VQDHSLTTKVTESRVTPRTGNKITRLDPVPSLGNGESSHAVSKNSSPGKFKRKERWLPPDTSTNSSSSNLPITDSISKAIPGRAARHKIVAPPESHSCSLRSASSRRIIPESTTIFMDRALKEALMDSSIEAAEKLIANLHTLKAQSRPLPKALPASKHDR